MRTVLVCGGRDFDQWRLVHETLATLHGEDAIGCVVEGGARGADYLGKKWARNNGVATACFEANWTRYGKRAGYIRNSWMLQFGKPDLVVAFPGGKGTESMVAQSQAAGITVRKIGWGTNTSA